MGLGWRARQARMGQVVTKMRDLVHLWRDGYHFLLAKQLDGWQGIFIACSEKRVLANIRHNIIVRTLDLVDPVPLSHADRRQRTVPAWICIAIHT